MKNFKILFMAVLAACLTSCLGDSEDDPSSSASQVAFEKINFEKAQLPTGGDNPGVLIGQSYESENGYVFQNVYSDGYNSGYTVSNNNDGKTAGYENQYSVYSASNNQNNQFLIYNPPYGSKAYIQRADGQAFYPYTIFVAPTTYTMLSIFNGDSFAKKFTENDTLSVSIKGCDAAGEILKDSEVKFDLVRKLSLFQYDSYYGYGYTKFVNIDSTSNLWTLIPLYYLGKVSKILIEFDSTDKGAYGINTPEYLALDDFTVVSQETISAYEEYQRKANSN